MIVLGLLFMAAAIAAAIVLVAQNSGDITVHAINSDYTVHAYWLAVAGLAIMAVFAAGLFMSNAGMARARRLRRERRELMRENRRLAERVDDAPAATIAPAATPEPRADSAEPLWRRENTRPADETVVAPSYQNAGRTPENGPYSTR